MIDEIDITALRAAVAARNRRRRLVWLAQQGMSAMTRCFPLCRVTRRLRLMC